MPLLKNGSATVVVEECGTGQKEKEDEEDEDDALMFPITDITGEDNGVGLPVRGYDSANYNSTSNTNGCYKPFITRKQRRRSLLIGTTIAGFDRLLQRLDSGVHDCSPTIVEPLGPRERWKMAVKKIHTMKDPWRKFHLDEYPAERVIRHRYNAITRKWCVDEAIVKMEPEAFNRGAMRTCYRLKKLMKIPTANKHQSLQELVANLTYSQVCDWSAATNNFVAKKYMEDVEREVYFHDVQLQMDAKLWGEEYNRHKPPKQVDIIQMAILEFKDRPDKALYHLEHFIEGDYKKYNSNSGFVEDHWRMTPQTFSHFTFERSGHHMMVVDIQGVGDLYTDPQIHTFDGTQYGDGNLGTRGMALFFHSHLCNDICRSLGLSKFDLYQTEIPDGDTFRALEASGKSDFFEKFQATRIRGHEEAIDFDSSSNFSLPFSYDESFVSSFFSSHAAQRTISTSSTRSNDNNNDDDNDEDDDDTSRNTDEGIASPRYRPFERPKLNRPFLSGSDSSATATEEEERRNFQMALRRGSRSSCVHFEMQKRSFEIAHGDSILGLVHHELAKYHEIGRFCKEEGEAVDAKAALYHEQQAADLGVSEAAWTLACIQLMMPHDVMPSISVENENRDLGFEYMKMAAYGGDRKAMLFLAKAYETGSGLPEGNSTSYREAVAWYEKALDRFEVGSEPSTGFDSTMDDPPYQIKASLAQMYMNGGYGLSPDPNRAGDLYNEAAEGAMEAMKGKLANKYYAMAEEAYAAVEDED